MSKIKKKELLTMIEGLTDSITDLDRMMMSAEERIKTMSLSLKSLCEVVHEQNRMIDQLRYGLPENATKLSVEPMIHVKSKRKYVKSGKYQKGDCNASNR
jgi:hypothetical protein